MHNTEQMNVLEKEFSGNGDISSAKRLKSKVRKMTKKESDARERLDWFYFRCVTNPTRNS